MAEVAFRGAARRVPAGRLAGELLAQSRRAASGALQPRGGAPVSGPPPPQRWLPVNEPSVVDTKGHSPRAGWQVVQKWRRRSAGPDRGSSELVRELRRQLRPPPGAPPVKASYWRKAAARAGQLAEYLSPEETTELLATLADAKLQWRGHAASEEGLGSLASGAALEIGSYTPAQRGELAWAFARLGFLHEDFMQALSRATEHTVRAARGRMSNESACALLASYRKLGVLDEPAMKSLSRLICRRLVREPLTPEQTADVVLAYSELQVRDTALFNATTLALCRPGAVEQLSWDQLTSTALSYASLRLHSASLFGRIRKRVCASAGLAADPAADEAEAPAASAAWGRGALESPRALLLEQLAEGRPAAPVEQLPGRAVARLLEAQVHLERVSAADLAPLLPHLSHPEGARLPTEPAALLAVALSRGGHVWPCLWRRALSAFADERLPAEGLLALADALQAHVARLRPLLPTGEGEDWWGARRSEGAAGRLQLELAQHLQALAGSFLHLWNHLGRLCRALPDVELRRVLTVAAGLQELQSPVLRALDISAAAAGAASSSAPLEAAASRTARQLGGEFAKRGLESPEELAGLLEGCQVRPELVQEDLRLRAMDSIAA